MENPLAIELDDIAFEEISPDDAVMTSLESLATGHGMDEVSASILPSWCCSCPCCCCC